MLPNRFRRGGLWYVPIMHKASPSVNPTARPVGAGPLSVIHARSLYRPVPPVGYDDDGYVCGDGMGSESDAHDQQRGYAGTVLRNRYLDDPNVFVGCNLTVRKRRKRASRNSSVDLTRAVTAARPTAASVLERRPSLHMSQVFDQRCKLLLDGSRTRETRSRTPETR